MLVSAHLKRVKSDLKKAKRLVKREDVKGEKALALSLKKYASHELRARDKTLVDQNISSFLVFGINLYS